MYLFLNVLLGELGLRIRVPRTASSEKKQLQTGLCSAQDPHMLGTEAKIEVKHCHCITPCYPGTNACTSYLPYHSCHVLPRRTIQTSSTSTSVAIQFLISNLPVLSASVTSAKDATHTHYKQGGERVILQSQSKHWISVTFTMHESGLWLTYT